MTTVMLDVTLLLTAAFAGWIAALRGTSAAGAVGGWLILVPPIGLLLAALVLMIHDGRFDWTNAPRAILYAAIPGILGAATASMLWSLDKQDDWWRTYAAWGIWLLVAALLFATHGIRVPAGIVLGPAAVAGWVLLFVGIVAVNSPGTLSPERQKKYDDFVAAQEAEKMAAFRVLGRDRGIEAYLPYAMASRQLDILTEARQLIASKPDRDEQLGALLSDPKYSEDVVRYIATVHEKPSAKLAPAMRRVLEADLVKWRAELKDVDQPWARSISFQSVVIAGAKVQKGGGDLRKQLTAWREFLVAMGGCDYLVKYVDESLNYTPQQ